MKKTLVLLLVLVLSSCSLDNDISSNYQELLPVETAILPEEFVLNEIYDITVSYLTPSNCHYFNDIYYVKENNERTVAIISTVYEDNGNCVDFETSEIPELEATFQFRATQTGLYIFKFWQGENENGENQYLNIEVQAIE